MAAYAYPIIIKRNRQRIYFDEVKEFDGNSLTLDDLLFVGEDPFSITEREWDGYIISVRRMRLETIEEKNRRVAGEESYMAEYTKRKLKLEKEISLIKTNVK